jgi:hypothetical protein
MPKSWPWYAPEHHHRGFTFEAARRMDIYSFGMLCLWFIFAEQIKDLAEKGGIEETGQQITSAYIGTAQTEHVLELLYKFKVQDRVQVLADQLCRTSCTLSPQQKNKLEKFFAMTLGSEPETRVPHLDLLLEFLIPEP